MEDIPRIIICNDDPTYLELIQELLIERGYPIVTVIQGEQAYRSIREQLPDLILIDINIRNSSIGWSTLDRVKMDPTTTRIPIIICSTDPALPHRKADWLRQKNVRFLEKPFELDDLVIEIVKCIGPPPGAE